jgi:hypothetical protein
MRKQPRPPGTPIRQSVREIRENIQERIAAIPAVKSYLQKLKARGLSPKKVLQYAATLVLLDMRAEWRQDRRIRRNPQNWRRLARRIRKVVGEVEYTYSNDSTRPDVLAMSLGGIAWLEPAPPLYNPQEAIERMRDVASDLEEKARLSGRIRKTAIPWMRRRPEVALLRHAWKATPLSASKPSRKRLRNLFQLLAELLHTVYEAYGVKPRFSADSLQKTFKRHVLPGLAAR